MIGGDSMKFWLGALLALLPTAAWARDCPPSGWTRNGLEALRAARFEIADATARERFAEAIMACVDAHDPVLRDGIAFEGVTHLLRAGQLGTATKLRIARDLLARLGQSDPEGFGPPFAALLLSEIIRADMVSTYLPADLRDAIVAAGADYVVNVRDYRGFDAREGWRHGVAHGADLLMQIARNPNIAVRPQLERVRDAVAAQAAPAGHFYIYGEPERLAQPILFLARRRIFSEAEWAAWFMRIAETARQDAVGTQAGLARRHNARAFLFAILVSARLDPDADDDVLLSGAEAALRAR